MGNDLVTSYKVAVRNSSIHGRGVFAKENIERDTIIEESYLVDSGLEIESVRKCNVMNNYFWSTLDGGRYLLTIGLACAFNESKNPNTKIEYIVEENIYRFTTTRYIEKDEELFINYADRIIR